MSAAASCGPRPPSAISRTHRARCSPSQPTWAQTFRRPSAMQVKPAPLRCAPTSHHAAKASRLAAAFAHARVKRAAIRSLIAGPPKPIRRPRLDDALRKPAPTARRKNAQPECMADESAPILAARADRSRSPLSFAANSPDRSNPAPRDRKCKPAQIAQPPRELPSSSGTSPKFPTRRSPLARSCPARTCKNRRNAAFDRQYRSSAPAEDSGVDRPPFPPLGRSLQQQ